MNRLTTLFLAFLLCIISADAFAQKCRFEKDELDGFTKERFRLAPRLPISKSPPWWVQMEQKKDKYFFNIQIFVLGEVRVRMEQGNKILAKLEDGSIIELIADKEIIPKFDLYANSVSTEWAIRASVSEDDMKKFSASPIQLMRTTIGGTEYNMPDAGPRYTAKIAEMATCMLKKD